MKADPGYFGPDSMMWKVNKEITVLFGEQILFFLFCSAIVLGTFFERKYKFLQRI